MENVLKNKRWNICFWIDGLGQVETEGHTWIGVHILFVLFLLNRLITGKNICNRYMVKGKWPEYRAIGYDEEDKKYYVHS